MNQNTTPKSSTQHKIASADLVSLVAALIFGAAGVVSLAGEPLAEIDLVVLAAAALVVIGLTRFVVVPVRSRARRRAAAEPAEHQDEQDQAKDQDQTQEQDQTTES